MAIDQIRDAQADERGELEALAMRASLTWPENRPGLEGHPETSAIDEQAFEIGRVRVAEQGGIIVGFSVVLPRDDSTSELDGLFTEPAAMRSGIGSALAEDAFEVAAATGRATIHVVAHPRALAFYRRCGFRELGPTETRFGTAVTMIRKP